ncbi:MAG: winged helix-turn-helix transcriptional regulator [Deltaproteobacteria bacterium]|nr:winged helix-turn-helix transcriptional regulator [Deltaproteobacteria bacterium]MBW2129288.1 winged helix-turn-helix transcriptional regulator [Deltaproteobacteria bacterium]MBW2304832.1 winged helix-turn-helix transcriptional regulator [Deltaproteobacteria bacterium]
MQNFLKAMKALSDPNRVKIIKMLQRRTLCVCEIQAALEVSQPTVSKHLKILEDAGFVSSEKDGLWVNYRLADGNESPYVATLLGNLRHWLEDDPGVASILAKLPGIRREEVCRR